MKKKANGESLEAKKNRSFIRKIDQEVFKEYVRKYPDHTLAEMKQNLEFGISSIWYRLRQLKITLQRGSLCIKDHDQEDRQRFFDKISKIDYSSIFLYIDEEGFDNRLYREYGRASREEKIYADISGKTGKSHYNGGGSRRSSFHQ